MIIDCLEVINDPNNSDVKQFLINKGEIADDSATSQTPETPDAGQDSRAEAQKILGEAYPSYSAPGETSDRKMGEKGGSIYLDYNKKFNPLNPTPDTDPAGGAKLTPQQLAPYNIPGSELLNQQNSQIDESAEEGKDYVRPLGFTLKSPEGFGPDAMKKPFFGLFQK